MSPIIFVHWCIVYFKFIPLFLERLFGTLLHVRLELHRGTRSLLLSADNAAQKEGPRYYSVKLMRGLCICCAFLRHDGQLPRLPSPPTPNTSSATLLYLIFLHRKCITHCKIIGEKCETKQFYIFR